MLVCIHICMLDTTPDLNLDNFHEYCNTIKLIVYSVYCKHVLLLSPCRQAHIHFHSDSSTKSNSISYLGEKRNNLDKILNYVSV